MRESLIVREELNRGELGGIIGKELNKGRETFKKHNYNVKYLILTLSK